MGFIPYKIFILILLIVLLTCCNASLVVYSPANQVSIPTSPVLDFTGATGVNGKVGQSMTVSPTVFSSQSTVTNCTISPALPAGLNIDPTSCIISGTPSEYLSTTVFTVSATNSIGTTDATISLSVTDAPTISYSGITSLGRLGVAYSKSPSTLNSNGANISSCTASPALPAWASIDSSTCTISGTPSETVDQTYTISATNSSGTSTSTFRILISPCPINYELVSANTNLGTNSNFCVAKFEMKNVGEVATSQASGSPWVYITQINAKTACKNLGTKYDLISNQEWMTIAFETEANPSNWNSGIVGSGSMFQGHSASSPYIPLAVIDENDPYNGTLNNASQAMGSGKEQRRTLALSSGAIIWDFSGNVTEWTDWILGGDLDSGPTSCAAGWRDLKDINCPALLAIDYMPGNPGGIPVYDFNYRIGQMFGGAGGAALRGGSFNGNPEYSGVFSLLFSQNSSGSFDSVGFRCVYRP